MEKESVSAKCQLNLDTFMTVYIQCSKKQTSSFKEAEIIFGPFSWGFTVFRFQDYLWADNSLLYPTPCMLWSNPKVQHFWSWSQRARSTIRVLDLAVDQRWHQKMISDLGKDYAHSSSQEGVPEMTWSFNMKTAWSLMNDNFELAICSTQW